MSVRDSHIKRFPGADPVALDERGYTVVRGLLGAEEVQQLRATVREAVAEAEREGHSASERGSEGTIRGGGDVLSTPSLRHVLLDPRLLGVVGELLGGEPLYFGDSSFRVGRNGLRSWHRDNVDRRRWRGGPDWRDPYPLLRCGLYLQDQSRHSGGLALRPGSSRLGLVRPTLPKLVDAHAGDLVVWKLRTVHSGEAVRPRWLPDLALHPRLQTRLPQSMRLPDDGERIVLFMTFGLEGDHLEHYIEYLKGRDYMQAAWAGSRFGPEVWEQAERAGLHVLQPVPAYGAPPNRPD
ncbi:MAG: phytanoyl-CoA dioxygenase family protein [Solirubrobacterales bacterium]